ncbi:MAG: translation initiation factor IF-2 N-terminal domain-containing protein, partial [Deltaproteobacteria bacterium]|nr:translation initiation factor IF-2 N-terminal domain-containing protein [Deltaproteobacteria bacterium]
MSKTRVYVLAKELGFDSKEFITRLEQLGIAVKSHSSTLSDSDVERIRREFALGERSKVVEKRVKSTVIRRRRIAEIAAKEEKPPDTEGGETAEMEVVPVGKPAADIEAKPTIEKKEVTEPIGVKKKEEKQIPEISKAEVIDTTEMKVPDAKAKAVEEKPRIAKETKPEIEGEEEKKKEKIKPKELGKPDAEKAVKPEKIEETAKKVSPEIKKEEKPEDVTSEKKKKRPIKVVMDEQEAPRKKSFIKQRIEKKAKRLGKNVDDGRIVARKTDKKEAVLKMKKTEITTPKAIKRRIKVGEAIRVGDLAKKMGVKSNELIGKLISLGIMVTI